VEAQVTSALSTRDAALQRVIALINDKGGVGKTTLTANLGGQLAAAGYRVLLVDLNRQANLADDFGYRDEGAVDDQGAGLLSAVLTGGQLSPAKNVRPNLDVVTGGIRLTDLTPVIMSRLQQEGRAAFLALGDALMPLADSYDVILIDSPPENVVLADLALAAARWVLMPTKSDAGGLVGMKLVAERFRLARELNPHLGLLGVVLFATLSNATAIHAEVRKDVKKAFGGSSPMFDAVIRSSERTAKDCRDRGLLAHELEADIANQPSWWEALRNGEKPVRTSATVASLAADYRDLAVETLQVLAAAEARAATA
jgi:chromosome partitioning protein